MTPRLFVMVGVPGSGKTTYARRHLKDALRVSLDDLRLMLSGKTFDARLERAVAEAGEALLETMARYAARTGCDLVFDATNISRERRAKVIALARRHGLSPVAVYLGCSLPTARRRNQQRPVPVPEETVTSFAQRLEPPTLAEGFSEIIHVPDREEAPRTPG